MIEKFISEKDFSIDTLMENLSQYFNETDESQNSYSLEIIDTFDWRLFNAGKILIRCQKDLSLLDLKTNTTIETINNFNASMPRFHWQLKDSPLKELIAGDSDIRALITHLKKTVTKKIIKLLDEDKKTVSKIELLRFENSENEKNMPESITIHPVRGYEKEFKNTKKAVMESRFLKQKENEYTIVLKNAGITPGWYSKKPEFSIRKKDGAEKACRHMILRLIDIIEFNEDGIKKDIDSEFLHDFRISVRKCRSLLSQIKNIFPPEITESLRLDFKSLGNMTNVLRDTDVYLLEEDYFKSMLPAEFKEGIEPLFRSLKSSRKKELKSLVSFLDSEEYLNLKKGIKEFCSSAPDSDAESSKVPVLEYSAKRIFKRYSNIIKSGTRITKETPDDNIHDLRIECKKLRYLLEFFSSLYPAKKTELLIKELKKLQDNLGLFNDLSVQKEFLLKRLSSIGTRNRNMISYAASIGALTANIEAKKKEVRNEFFTRFEAFNSMENKKMYSELFKS